MRIVGKAVAGGSLGCLVILGCGKTIPVAADTTCPCAPGWSCCDTICVQGECPELDYMTRDKTPLNTSWYAYSDRTCPLSCPPVFMEDWTGSLTPHEMQPFPPSSVDGGPTIHGQPWPYREVTGGGESNWGIGFGFDFRDEAGPSPVAHCKAGWCPLAPEEAGDDAGDEDSGIACNKDGQYALQPVLTDESVHRGISFWARAPSASDASPLTLTLHISDIHTADVGYAYIDGGVDGGACNPCIFGKKDACGDDFLANWPVTPTWTQYVAEFSKLKQNGFSQLPPRIDSGPPKIDSRHLGHVNFEVQIGNGIGNNNGNPLTPFKVDIAYVEWADWVEE
jgi:hypothetical protein